MAVTPEISYEAFITHQEIVDRELTTEQTPVKKRLTPSEEIKFYCADFTRVIPLDDSNDGIQKKQADCGSNIFGIWRPLNFPGIVKEQTNNG